MKYKIVNRVVDFSNDKKHYFNDGSHPRLDTYMLQVVDLKDKHGLFEVRYGSMLVPKYSYFTVKLGMIEGTLKAICKRAGLKFEVVK